MGSIFKFWADIFTYIAILSARFFGTSSEKAEQSLWEATKALYQNHAIFTWICIVVFVIVLVIIWSWLACIYSCVSCAMLCVPTTKNGFIALVVVLIIMTILTLIYSLVWMSDDDFLSLAHIINRTSSGTELS